ncbi:MAG: DUF1553 domain-containing protein [Planctomycetes bacterium]|nr:DUF1553 domain-containing protein [Planctomycetota bacterium]MCW8136724.1 DUF1553 domain-containing protein [Planctomycetota bacterium]
MRALAGVFLLAAAACCWLAQPAPVQADDKATAAGAALSATIDREIDGVLKRDGIKPAPRSSDAEFIRRVYLDTVGMPPSYDEAVAFLDDTGKDKRNKLIDRLLNDPRFGRHFADHWSVLLTPRNANALSGGTYFADWMAGRVNAGVSFAQVIREIITARGDIADNPAVVPWFRDGQGELITDMSGKLTRSLMGVQIQCAECHDHPYDEAISQKTFQGMVAFLAPSRATVDQRRQPPEIVVRDDPATVNRIFEAIKNYDKLRKDQQAQVDFYRPYVNPVTLTGAKAEEKPELWRDELAAWWIDKANLQTRRYVANRMWFMAFGTGLVNPPDDFNPLNEPSHPQLLDALAAELLRSGWDVRGLYRAILRSETYQRSSAGGGGQRWHYARYPVRALTPEQFLTSLIGLMEPAQRNRLITDGFENTFVAARAQFKRNAEQRQDYSFDEDRLNRFEQRFRKVDGRWWMARMSAGRYVSLSTDDENTAADGFSLSINQALAVMNGEFTNNLAGSGESTLLGHILKRHEDPGVRFDAIYLTILSRKPTDTERQRWRDLIKGERNVLPLVEDLIFALLMTTEFGTNH